MPAPTSTTPIMIGTKIDTPVLARSPEVFFGCGAGEVVVGVSTGDVVVVSDVVGGVVDVVVSGVASAHLALAAAAISLFSAFATISDWVGFSA